MVSAMPIFVFAKKTAYMQRIADLVRYGHIRYVSGVVPVEKAEPLQSKFERFYDVHLDRFQAARKRKEGYATARLLMLYTEGYDTLQWILLQTAGQPLIEGYADLEAWRDPRERTQRITLTGYELVRIVKNTSTGPVWTWRYTREREADLRDDLIQTIRRKADRELAQKIETVWRSPGFAGVRVQVKKMGELIRSEWKRSRGKEALPEIPTRIGYVRRVADLGGYLKQGADDEWFIEGRRKKRRGAVQGPSRRSGTSGPGAGTGAAEKCAGGSGRSADDGAETATGESGERTDAGG